MADGNRQRSDILRSHDLQLLATAAYYDLADEQERIRSTRELELLFFRLVRHLEPELFLEAGAKDAGASRRARRRLPDAEIIAFEANPHTHERFRGNKKNRRLGVDYRPQALSREPGRIGFNIRLDDEGHPIADGQGSLLRRDDHAPGHETVEVEATTIDTVFAASVAETMALWVDVEGAAEAVLTGARLGLSRTSAVFIEVEDHEFWPGQWLSRQVMTYLWEAGLTPVARDFQSHRQFNVVFVADAMLDTVACRLALARYHATATRPDTNTRQATEPARDWLRHTARRLRR